MIGILIKSGRSGHAPEEDHRNMEAEIRVMCLQTKEHQRWPENHQKLIERHGTEFSPHNPAKELTLALAFKAAEL